MAEARKDRWTIYEIREATPEELEAAFGDPSCEVVPVSKNAVEYTLCKHCGGKIRERREGSGDWVHSTYPTVAESHGAVPAVFVLKEAMP